MPISKIRTLSKELRDGKVSAMELTTRTIECIKTLNQDINAFEFVDEESALTAAKNCDEELRSGQDRGPLHGIPIGIKDIINVENWPTRCGAETYDSRPKKNDAEVIRQLRKAGAILVGKTVPHELACGIASYPAKNPWDQKYIPGGSSGGSAAAVAAGIVPMALGSDTGGSIRIPSAACGITGIKPTFGSVPCGGIEPLSWSLDHIGALASSVEDCALLLHSITNTNRPDLTLFLESINQKKVSELKDCRIGVIRSEPFEPIQNEIREIFDVAMLQLESMGAQIVDVEIPELKHTIAAEFAIICFEAGYYHKDRLVDFANEIDADIKYLLIAGNLLPTEQYFRGLHARNIIADAIRHCFDRYELSVIATPTLPAPIAKTDQTDFRYGDKDEPVTISYVRTTAPFNLAGIPALSTPCGLDSNGLPVGLQIAGRAMDEFTICTVGHAYESVVKWENMTP